MYVIIDFWWSCLYTARMLRLKTIEDNHPSIAEAGDFAAMCNGALGHLGITCFGHAEIDTNHAVAFMCSDPTFLLNYISSDAHTHSLIQQKPKFDEQYVMADSLTRIDKCLAGYEMLKHHGHGHQFSIIRLENGIRNYYHFSTVLGNDYMNSKYLWHLPELKDFIENEYQEYLDKIGQAQRAHDMKLTLPPPVDNFINFDDPLAEYDLKRIPYRGSYITKREFECLHWLSSNKNVKQVADILNISPRTVKAHTDSIKGKTGCKTQFHLGMLYHELRIHSDYFLQ